MMNLDQILNSQKTPYISPSRANCRMSIVSILENNESVIKGWYCVLQNPKQPMISHNITCINLSYLISVYGKDNPMLC